MNEHKIKCFVTFGLLTATLLLAAALFGCTETEIPAPQTQPAEALIQFTDDDGRDILLDSPCSRIITLYSAHTENLFSLGAGNLIIGACSTSIYPPETLEIPHYEYNDDPETIIAAGPDLVLIRPLITRKVPGFVQAIERAGIPVVSLYPEKFDGFEDYIGKLALLTDLENAAAEQLSQFYKNIAAVTTLTKDITEKQNIFFESTTVNLRTITAESMPAHAIAFAGGTNVAAEAKPMRENTSIASFGAEQILALADEIDVYVAQCGAMNAGCNLHSILARPGFETIKAVRDGRVYLINEKIISSPTFRFCKGVLELARYLYPDLLDDLSPYQNDRAAGKRDLANILVRKLHIPFYLPNSLKYYQQNNPGHVYGLFSDVTWQDEDFDYIETAVAGGYIPYKVAGDGVELFYPEAPVTREMLAKAVFMLGDFKRQDDSAIIVDLGQCDAPAPVQILVDNGVFSLHNGNFEPQRNVTNNEIIAALSFVSQASGVCAGILGR